MNIPALTSVARIIKAEGVPWVSTFPTCSLLNTLGEENIPIIMMREERYSVGIADAFSRMTDGARIGACTILGGANPTGLQIAYGAVMEAFEDGSPLLAFTDTTPEGSSANSRFDIMAAYKDITKWVGRIDQPQQVPEVMRRAFTYLRTGRRGPVLIGLARGLGEYDDEQYPYTPVKGWRSGPDPADVKAAIKALLAAKKPLLFVGEGVFYGQATAALRQFAEMAQIPVLTTLKGKSAFPENHPLSVGVRGELANSFLQSCDLLFVIGASLFPGFFSHAVPDARHKIIVQCLLDDMDVNRHNKADHAVIGDAGLTLPALIAELSAQTGGGAKKNQALLDEIKAAKAQFMAKYGPLLESNDKPINPYRVIGDLMKAIDRNNSFVTADSGNTRDQVSTIYESLIPHGCMTWGNVTTLGFSLAAAMGAKLAFPERQCVNVTGDAGVGYMLGSLESLVRYNIGVTTVHINNGGFGGYGPGFWGKGHHPYTSMVSDHSVADMSKAVQAIGYYAEDVTEPSEIIPALKRAFAENAHGRPAYLEFICSLYPVYGAWATAGPVAH